MRTSRHLLSEGFLPWMHGVRWLATQLAADRHPAAPDNPFKEQEEHIFSRVTEAIAQGRRLRDAVWERAFDELYSGAGSTRPVDMEPQDRGEDTRPQDTRSGLDFQAAGISRAAATRGN